MYQIQARDIAPGMRVKVKPCRRLQPVREVHRGSVTTILIFDLPANADRQRDDGTTTFHPETVTITNTQPVLACGCNSCANLRPCAQEKRTS